MASLSKLPPRPQARRTSPVYPCARGLGALALVAACAAGALGCVGTVVEADDGAGSPDDAQTGRVYADALRIAWENDTGGDVGQPGGVAPEEWDGGAGAAGAGGGGVAGSGDEGGSAGAAQAGPDQEAGGGAGA
ncbi:MAG: hypothetical protein HY744_16200 [Deltaproteobacteria bacterium]|nr:hypothetical protein [Deltaproteobacteria bacterium]